MFARLARLLPSSPPIRKACRTFNAVRPTGNARFTSTASASFLSHCYFSFFLRPEKNAVRTFQFAPILLLVRRAPLIVAILQCENQIRRFPSTKRPRKDDAPPVFYGGGPILTFLPSDQKAGLSVLSKALERART